ncbi:hypothetical protein SAMN05192539_103672 [Paraburkholderia diazotrophica]|uniref:Uncharacterized protein n=1 Tax=Paraburkholderia diazotrophica TaxID=667676 RepID=A0A1H7DX66_9BURK|nr:hypothetical protein SAMN05192539_103672 [Paraburkholderia diazotrophica]
MTVIGAPQYRQMKMGRVSMAVSWSDGLRAYARRTAVHARTFARLARRTGYRVGKQSRNDAYDGSRRADHGKQETTHELAGFEDHGLVAGTPLRAVVLPAERDTTLIKGDETLEIATRYV